MPEFLYKATTVTGQSVEGRMDGKDEATVVQSLHQLGYIPIRITSTLEKGRSLGLSSLFPQRVGVKQLLTFTQELSTLIAAGLPIDRSLSILSNLTENAKLKDIVQDVLKRIEGGSSLGDALSQYPRVFPKLYTNMVKAGESGGFLESILSRLVDYLESSKELREHLKSVMIYPLFLTIVSGVSVAILVTFVIPRFEMIFSTMGRAIPLPTQIILTFSQFVTKYWWAGLGAVMLLWSSMRAYVQDEERRWKWDRFKLKRFLIGDLIRQIEVARFARTLGTLLQSGVPILPALNLVKEISQNLVIVRSIAHVHERLREGKSVSKSLEETEAFPPLAIHMIAVGEETGRLDEMLMKVAGAFEENVKATVKRVVSLLEPLIIVIMGGIIFFIVISIMWAILSVNEIPF